MNDDSDVDNISSDQEHQKTPVDKNKNHEVPPLQKTLSSPQQLSKSQRTDNNPRITQNLQKLTKHTDSKVWLYLAEFPGRQAEVNQILNQNSQFEKVNSLSKGWNVLIKTQVASKYIEKGLYQKGLLLKFIYSNRNELKNQTKQSRRIEKKYSQKYRDNKGSYDQEQIVSPKIKSKQTYNDRTNYQKERQYNQGGEKKKVKYVAKNDVPKKIEEVAQPPNSPNQAGSNQTKQIQKVSQIIDKLEPVETDQKLEGEANQKESKLKNGSQERDRQNQKEDKDSEKDQKSQSEESQPKEKKKKLKKKNKSKGGSFVDPNNPYSALF